MSKTLAQLARLLGASNEQLFDRYINIRLTADKPISGGIRKPDDFEIRTPATGLKPSITVSGQFHVQNTANSINITVYNMSANIDTMAYNWAVVEVGYLNSSISAKFIGQITNCYMAKPNPNGELVITVTCAYITDLYSQGDFLVSFPTETVNTAMLVQTCVKAITAKYPELSTDLLSAELTTSLPAKWQSQIFTVGRATRHFRSPLECLTWMNSLFATYSNNTGFAFGAGGTAPASAEETKRAKLPPLRLGFDSQGKLSFTGTYSEVMPTTVKALSCIGTAFLTGTKSATVTAPFNPGISPGEVIYIDTKYFKTRVNIDAIRTAYKSMGNLWYVIEVAFTFSTQTTNTMTLKLNNIDNKITVKEG